MSVINKMLRDLDARRSDGAAPDRPRQAGPAVIRGTVSVQPAGPQAPARRLRWLLLSALVLLAIAAAAYWYLGTQAVATPQAVAPVVALAPSPVAPAPAASAPETAASAPSAPQAPVEAEPEPPVVRKSSSRIGTARSADKSADKSAGRSDDTTTAGKTGTSRKRAAEPTAAQAPVPAASAVATAAPPNTAPASPPAPLRRQGPVQETLAQAQALWSAGSREPALELVREAVAAVERSQPPDAALLAQLVREQSRMELAQGRPGVVLDLLTRLEPMLAGQADLWAVRGNAAQRLGRHQESVQAYLAALQLRPGESRWMLGAAVSLAALGQLDAAGRQAEQARALGPVSPEVLTYLRQAGVPLR